MWKISLAVLLLAFTSVNAAETYITYGPTQIKDRKHTGHMVTLSRRFNDTYDVTFGWVSQQNFRLDDCGTSTTTWCDWKIKPNLFVGVDYLFGGEKLKFGIGPAYFQNADRIVTSNFRAHLKIEYRFNSHFGLEISHHSSGGSSQERTFCRKAPNLGEYYAVEIPLFEPYPEGWRCSTNDWNTGLDSFIRLQYFF